MVSSDTASAEKPLQVFIPEIVPLENKGEEAIIRGLHDILFPETPVHFHFLAQNCSNPETIGNFTIYPSRWFYPIWVFREPAISWNPLDVLNLAGLVFQGVRNRVPFTARTPHAAVWLNQKLLNPQGLSAKIWRSRAAAVQKLASVDFVLAGHDNAMGLREAHVLQNMVNRGMHFGIFGCGMNSRFANKTVAEVYRSTFQHAKFLYFRDADTFKGIRERGNLPDARLAPDPAFGMHPADAATIDRFLKTENLSAFFKKPVVAVTVVENAVVFQSFKAHKSTRQKAEAHYRLVGQFVDHIVKNWGANVLFLPHCIGPTRRLDDRWVARNVMRHCTPSDSVRILETTCGARILKGLIQRSTLLVGERTHSLIGSVSVGTPFICLGNPRDKRTAEIIGTMCKCSDLVYDLSAPTIESLTQFGDQVWQSRDTARARVQKAGQAIKAELLEAAANARSRMAPFLGKRPATS